MIILWIYLAGLVVTWIIGMVVAFYINPANLDCDFEDFMTEEVGPIVAITFGISLFWPITLPIGIVVGILWLIWKALHSRALIKRAVGG